MRIMIMIMNHHHYPKNLISILTTIQLLLLFLLPSDSFRTLRGKLGLVLLSDTDGGGGESILVRDEFDRVDDDRVDDL